jgi:hypothetical protein
MRTAVAAVLCCLALAACGFDVQSPDDFLMTRTGQGQRVTFLVNDAGTIRCDGGRQRPITSSLLISARALVTNLQTDAQNHLNLPQASNSVYRFTMRMQLGTIGFPDTAAAGHHELAGAEQFALQALAGPCKSLGQ